MKKASRKPRGNLYLVRHFYKSYQLAQMLTFEKVFHSKKKAIEFLKINGGVLTRWEYAEQIEVVRANEKKK